MQHKKLAAPRGSPDPAAQAVAGQLRAETDADCVILFGSRARGDYREDSDLDLIVIKQEKYEIPILNSLMRKAVSQYYASPPNYDLLQLTPDEYLELSRYTVNHVARAAWEEGVHLSRNPGEYGRSRGDEFRDDSREWHEAERRIADANDSYEAMHALIDAGIRGIRAVDAAATALEHGMKGLLSAYSIRHPGGHNLERLAAIIEKEIPGAPKYWSSNLANLGAYIGGVVYGNLTGTSPDFQQMADDVTNDLARMYELIERRTGVNPWEVPVREGEHRANPRLRL